MTAMKAVNRINAMLVTSAEMNLKDCVCLFADVEGWKGCCLLRDFEGIMFGCCLV